MSKSNRNKIITSYACAMALQRVMRVALTDGPRIANAMMTNQTWVESETSAAVKAIREEVKKTLVGLPPNDRGKALLGFKLATRQAIIQNQQTAEDIGILARPSEN